MTNKLEQKIIELETKHKDEVAVYEDEIMQLEHDLEISDNRILDLQNELHIEKTNDSKYQFYWFTAKKIPYDSDISYTTKENYLYDFKQSPKYSFIEYYDLRFVTHATLDDLIEQF